MFRFLNRFKYFDIPLLAATFLLVLAGLAILYATTLSEETKSVFFRQLFFLALGFGGFLFLSFFVYHRLAKINRIVYVLIVLLLSYLTLFGSIIRGGRRWLNVASFGFQPAEFVKLVVILGLARLLYLKRGEINSWKTLLWSFL